MRAKSFALLTNPRYVGRPLRANGGESAFTVSNLTTAVALMLLRGALYLRQEDLTWETQTQQRMNSGTFDIGTPATKAKRDINDKGITQKEFRAFRGTRVFKREEQR